MKKLFLIISVVFLFGVTSCGNIGGKTDEDSKTEQAEQVDKSNNTSENDNVQEGGPGEQKDSSKLAQEDTTKEASADSINKQIEYEGINLTEMQDSTSTRLNNLEKKVDNCYFCQDGLIAYAIFAVLILVLVLVVNRLLGAIFKSHHNKEDEKNAKFRHDAVDRLNRTEDLIYQQRDIIQRQNSNLKSELAAIRNQLSYMGSRPSITSVSQSVQSAPCPQNSQSNIEKISVFYLKNPIDDMTFENSHTSRSDAFYEFRLDRHNPNKAVFNFCPTDARAMTTALNSRRYIIEWACELMNTPTSTVSPCKPEGNDLGEAELRGEKWIVTKKQKVRYE